MRRMFSASVIVLAHFCALLFGREAPAGTLQILPIAGQAYGIDGNNIVGATAISHVGFLYDGNTYTSIAFPGASATEAYGISGKNIVGRYYDGSFHSFLFDGSSYTTFNGPPGSTGIAAYGIAGNKILGEYAAGGKVHGFVYDAGSWTTIDNPLGTKGTRLFGISGNNIVGSYTTSSGFERGFLYNGTTFTTLNDPLALGGATIPYGISGSTIVGSFSSLANSAFVYDGSNYTHPLGTGSGDTFRGISGNKIVGYERDFLTGIDHPIIYTIPEPSTLTLAIAALTALSLLVIHRQSRSSCRATMQFWSSQPRP